MLSDHIVLAGGGHTHALVLLRWAMNPKLKPAGMITLVNQSSTTIYSGMFPGVIAGKYKIDEILIDLRDLASKARVSFVMAQIEGIDLKKKKLLLVGRPEIEYSSLSLNIGTKTNLNSKPLITSDKNLAVPIKPFSESLKFIKDQDIYKDDSSAKPFEIVGAGFAGIEIAFSLRKRWPRRPIQLKVKSGRKLSSNILKAIEDLNIEIIQNNLSTSYPALICTGNESFEWIKDSGLPIDQFGRVLTKNTLQVINYPELFAVGDCGVIKDDFRPSSGVWAVRCAIPLAKNLEAMNIGSKFGKWKPQKNAIQLLDINSSKKDSKAFLAWGGFIIGPYSFLSRLKDLIDRNFISKFHFSNDLTSEMFSKREMIECRGCAAKLAYSPLKKTLKKLNLKEPPEDDSIDIGLLISGKTLIQSVDGFPSLVSDPWLTGRLLTFHSCSDIWACGGSVISAQSVVKLPSLANDVQQELLFQVLEGINSALTMQGAKLIGGHTLQSIKASDESSSLEIESSLTVNGIIDENANFWSKGGMKKGDQILISRPLGTGVIFSAFMNAQVRPHIIDFVLKEMNKSQHEIVRDITKLESKYPYVNIVNACTDITGFGLLGHLSEMLESTNSYRSNINIEPVKIILELDKIPFYNGVDELLDKGFESSLSPSNRIFLENINGHKNLRFELIYNEFELDSPLYNNMLKLLIDPQTCGPLVISCPSLYSEKLIEEGPWKKIGLVSG
ncbi:selenide, water dikinase SelD [Prochlorococcus marinus]|uniref:Selenide, water dikinase SelD n=1 Tax=Prochlorococcus marinus XMU1408 TaxID=2213228 RepID=A0A318R0G5_PROMR|nr:selenide, water dikinase SelD [Prochlorococcus marinus]MBW3041359.1 selenide, water dikinase SelD [Prochlorococcus marinus str. XMU1408]PYE02525.1 selenide, water dikinase SelD [Prochlorococcus marinus XMU1408]